MTDSAPAPAPEVAPRSAFLTASRWAAMSVLGTGITAAAIAKVAEPGLQLGSFVMGIVAVTIVRQAASFSFMRAAEVATGLGSVLWDGLATTRAGALVGKVMASGTGSLALSIVGVVGMVKASEGLGLGIVTPQNLALSFGAAAAFVVASGVSDRLAKVHKESKAEEQGPAPKPSV